MTAIGSTILCARVFGFTFKKKKTIILILFFERTAGEIKIFYQFSLIIIYTT